MGCLDWRRGRRVGDRVRCLHGEVYMNINYAWKYSSISKRRNWCSYEKNMDAAFLMVFELEFRLIHATHETFPPQT